MTTSRRALLIGSQTSGLRGANRDVATMDAILAKRAFERRVLTDENATRDGILDGFRALIRDTDLGDPVLLYYSGHGGRIGNPRHRPDHPEEPQHYACIVPFDHTRETFRGIFNSELSSFVAELSLRTSNITIILDCCHAAAMIKDETLRPKAIPIPWRDDIAAHREWLLAQGYDLRRRAAYVESNPRAVRLVACASEQLAYEVCRDDGLAGGLLTKALAEVLAASSPDATWQGIAYLVSARVVEYHAAQVPELHGPLGRTIFTTEHVSHTGILALIEHDGEPHLSGGSLHGVTLGSRYLLMPPNANRPHRDCAISEAHVLAVDNDRARVVLESCDDDAPPLGTRAFLYDPKVARHQVHLEIPPGALRKTIEAAFASSSRVEGASDTPRPFATLALKGECVEIIDRDGHQAHTPWPASHSTNWSTENCPPLNVLDQLARVDEFLNQPEPTEASKLLPLPTLKWGTVGEGGTELLPLTGAQVREGDKIFLRIRSHSAVPVFVNVLGVGISRSIRLLTASQPSGIRLQSQQTYTLGSGFAGQLVGVALRWSDEVPRDAAQPMHLLLIVSDRPVDLRSLESSFKEPDTHARSLDDCLSPHGQMVPRGSESQDKMKYSLSWLHFDVSSRDDA